jgi:hypothetical protein
MKILAVGAELFRVDGWTGGQTDTMKLIVAFRNVVNPPKNGLGGGGTTSDLKKPRNDLCRCEKKTRIDYGSDNATSPGAEFLHE